jgi:hypothetical protein
LAGGYRHVTESRGPNRSLLSVDVTNVTLLHIF